MGRWIAAALAAVTLGAATAGCGEDDVEREVGEAVTQIREGADDVGTDVGRGAEDVRTDVERELGE
jgi:hypothetical protein